MSALDQLAATVPPPKQWAPRDDDEAANILKAVDLGWGQQKIVDALKADGNGCSTSTLGVWLAKRREA